MLRPKPPPRFLDAKRIDEEGDGHVTILYDRKAADEHAIAAASVTTASNLFAFTIYTHPCSLTPTDRYALSEPLLSFPRQKLVTTGAPSLRDGGDPPVGPRQGRWSMLATPPRRWRPKSFFR